MTNRQSFHIYKILEDFSKEFISFDYTPKFQLIKNYYLSKNDINNILKENSKLIQALYNRDENIIYSILKKNDFDIKDFTSAQTEENINIKNCKQTPLPIQARYVLKGYNYLRINEVKEKKDKLIETFNSRAFDNSVFPQITKMALSFENKSFFLSSSIALKTCSTKEQYMLFYKLLAYYFRLNNEINLNTVCLSISNSFANSSNNVDIESINKIDAILIEKAAYTR